MNRTQDSSLRLKLLISNITRRTREKKEIDSKIDFKILNIQ